MTLKLLFNGGLLAFFTYCYIYITQTGGKPVEGELSGAQWSQLILVLLIVCLIINIIKIWRTTPAEERKLSAAEMNSFFNNKLLIGMALVLVYAYTLDYTGFLLGSFILSMAYTRLLGEKRIGRLIIYSLAAVVLLYILFYYGLAIMLPRGVGPLRDLALKLESLV